MGEFMSPAEIKKIRIKQNMTRTELAEYLGYKGYARVWEIENGKRNPGAAVVKLLELLRDKK
jgi:DNA-binding transcriptional regulator YiaG